MSDWTPQSPEGADPKAGLGSESMPEVISESAEPAQPNFFQSDSKGYVPSDGWKQVRVWMRDLAVSLCLAGFVILFLYQPVKVEGTSMEPRLIDQERVFINKFIYRIESVERGDVVVFWYPRDLTKSFIKRVVGVPGDNVEMRVGQLFVNGKQVPEPYLADGYRGEDSFAPVHVSEGEYFVLGDHRTSSNDSRAWGSVPQKYIYGKAQLVYWPMGKWGLLD